MAGFIDLLPTPALTGSGSTGSPHHATSQARSQRTTPRFRGSYYTLAARYHARMSRNLRVFQVDAFTRDRFTGNPAGVVLDAQGLEPAMMQAIARELGQGDTAFVLPPADGSHDLQVRFFTPRTEAGFVGHATLAAHAVLAALGLPEQPRQQQRTGLVTVERHDTEDGQRFAFCQAPPPLQLTPGPPRLDEALDALGIVRARPARAY
jgi:PhzF family phenazine biosynthesis protein